jgi:hypothetical protein
VFRACSTRLERIRPFRYVLGREFQAALGQSLRKTAHTFVRRPVAVRTGDHRDARMTQARQMLGDFGGRLAISR